MRAFLIVAACMVLCACDISIDGESETMDSVAFLNPPEMEGLSLPFTDAVRAGNLLFLSGKIGNLPGTMDLAPGGITAETRQVMEYIKQSVERNGSNMERVVKCTVFLADMSEWGAMNEVYASYFPGGKPARSALAASGLALGARVEIECIAAL